MPAKKSEKISKKKYLRILKTGTHREAVYLIQEIIPLHMFQCFIAFRGQTYQHYNIITPQHGKKKLSTEEVVGVIAFMISMVTTTVAQLEKLQTPKNATPLQLKKAN